MKIIVDSVGAKHGGGARVLVDVLCAMLQDDRVTEVVLFASPGRVRSFSLPIDPRLRVVDVKSAESPFGRILWALYGLRRACRGFDGDVFLGMNGLGPGGHLPQAVMIQQSLPFCPEIMPIYGFQGRLRIWMRRVLMRRSSAVANRVYVQTSIMKASVVRQFQLAPDRVEVFPSPPVLFSQPNPVRDAKDAHTSEYIVLYVGSSSLYKNLKVVAEGMEFVEGVKALFYATIEPGHPLCAKGYVTPLGQLDTDELHDAYSAADVLVMPSLTETVGLPMLEAMRVGTPVLAADRPYAHAVCGEAALYFDPLDARDFAEKLLSLFRDDALRARLTEAGRKLLLRLDDDKPYARMVEDLLSLAKGSK